MQKTKRVPFDTVADGELFIYRGLIMQRLNSKEALAVYHGTRFDMHRSTVVEVANA